MEKNLKDTLDMSAGMGGMDVSQSDMSGVDKPEAKSSEGKGGKTKTDLEEMNADERKVISEEQRESFLDASRRMCEIGEGMQTLLINPDGTPIDLSDKKGRTELISALKYFKKAMETFIEDLLEAIPKSVVARLCDEDRKRVDFLRKFQRNIYIGIGAMIALVALLFFMDGKVYEKANSRLEEANGLIERTEDVATFGNWMRKANPKTWEAYQTDKELRKEVYEKFGVKSKEE
jgi:hypothetical protein